MKKVTILDVIDELGRQALNYLSKKLEDYSVYAIAASEDMDTLIDLCIRHKPQVVVVNNKENMDYLFKHLRSNGMGNIEIWSDQHSLDYISSYSEVDIVISSLKGKRAVSACYAAVKSGKKLFLAYTDVLVIAGELLMNTARLNNATILPLSYEYNLMTYRIDEYVQSNRTLDNVESEISEILLTSTGGPFIYSTINQLKTIKAQEFARGLRSQSETLKAIQSSMMIDSYYELINIYRLCNLNETEIGITIHSQQKIHSIIKCRNGSSILQAVNNDHERSISTALDRSNIKKYQSNDQDDLFKEMSLSFYQPSIKRYPLVDLIMTGVHQCSRSCTILFAVTEVAIQAYIANKISFTQISNIVKNMLNQYSPEYCDSVTDIIELDHKVRVLTEKLIRTMI